MPDGLFDFWQKFDPRERPYVHPDDREILHQHREKYVAPEHEDFAGYLSHRDFGADDRRFHLSLLPIPFGGDLKRADIVILLLNPGFDHGDYYEMSVPELRKRLIENLHQNFEDAKYPFLWLDPQFCWSAGFRWWEKKLRGVIQSVGEKRQISYSEAMKYVAARVAHIELVPYHSSSFNAHALIQGDRELPSVRSVRRYVSEVLLPEALNGNKKVIVTRQEKNWKFDKGDKNVVVYEGGHTRGASLSPTSLGGRAILERLNA